MFQSHFFFELVDPGTCPKGGRAQALALGSGRGGLADFA